MNADRLEAFLARLYTDASFRRKALADPTRLAPDEREVLARIDRVGLELTARSLAIKSRRARGG